MGKMMTAEQRSIGRKIKCTVCFCKTQEQEIQSSETDRPEGGKGKGE